MIKKKIIIIDDNPLILSLVKEIIEEEHELEISHMTTEKNEFLNLVLQDSFDVALIDISVGGKNGGIELLQILKDKGINLPSIMFSAHSELDYALKCFQAGAKGYISKNYVCTDLITGLKEVLNGNSFISGEKGKKILNEYQKFTEVHMNISK